MLSRPDFMEKQIVVVSTFQSKDLSLQNDNLIVKQWEKLVNKLSCYKIFAIFIVWEFTITTKLVNRLLKYQIAIYSLDSLLRPQFMIGNPLQGNYLLREKQYEQKDNLAIAKHIVKNKMTNQFTLLKSLRNKDDSLKKTISNFGDLLYNFPNISDDESLRGNEWTASKYFFGQYFKELKRYKRMPRTRVDIPNFLMDIGYTYLYWFVEANLNLYGFDVYRGVYHKLFYERKSLVCDLVEPFRAIIDRAIRKMYNLNQVNEKDFKFKNQEYWIDREKRKKYTQLFLEQILLYKEEIFLYIKQYYKYVMNAEKNSFPTFYIHKKD